MQVMLSEEEQKKQDEIDAYNKQKEEELAERALNAKAKRKKADKAFQIIVFGIIFLVLVAVVLKWLFADASGLAY